jgi:hypothetical protein
MAIEKSSASPQPAGASHPGGDFHLPPPSTNPRFFRHDPRGCACHGSAAIVKRMTSFFRVLGDWEQRVTVAEAVVTDQAVVNPAEARRDHPRAVFAKEAFGLHGQRGGVSGPATQRRLVQEVSVLGGRRATSGRGQRSRRRGSSRGSGDWRASDAGFGACRPDGRLTRAELLATKVLLTLMPSIGKANRAIATLEGLFYGIPNPNVLLSPGARLVA